MLTEKLPNQGRYIYTFACHETERELCEMELRALFNAEPDALFYIDSSKQIDPSRSPFISMRMDVMFAGSTLEDVLGQIPSIELEGDSFKVLYIKGGAKHSYDEQRKLERQVGGCIRGTADMRKPDVMFGLLPVDTGWIFGLCHHAESVWLQHKDKPQNYSTGLSTVVARALVNIAVPDPHAVKVIDPCCGMGNVLIEALSMGINIVGRDINPLAIRGARINLLHFGYSDSDLVMIGDMNQIDQLYDAAILDMPYNLCSVLSEEETITMLTSVSRFSRLAVIVSSELLEEYIISAGFRIKDQCIVRKGSFVRNVWLCESGL
ncbi:putative RNA methylase [Fontibacillus solani]|uniref:Putative RNA methylase n=1 Tax=Fontibacillus solani TaxID=1572857 RepID=A0A7W3STN1_9BACL|nr:RNA methyltransferase [Fontibacillus solani]MBA9085874.1 putative RNA methylase [Fontibacillus solani]